MKNFVPYIFVVLFFMTGFFFRCANPAAPSGGLKDTLPPAILSITPNNFMTNFNSKTIVIEVDEYVQIKDAQKEIIIAPPMKKRPEFKAKGRTIEITFRSELDSATTYKIDFGKSIQDNNESNPLLNFSYIFSTGDYIDSLVMSGQMLNAETGDTIINGLVYLYNEDNDSLDVDSTIFIGEPISVARTDSNGVFIATNLKDMNYLVYGIEDENSNAFYDVGEDFVAFADTLLNPAKMPAFRMWYNHQRETAEATPQFIIRTFSEKQKRRQSLSDMKRLQRGVLSFVFAADSARVDSFKLDSIDPSLLFSEFNPTLDSLTVWIMQPDSVIADSINGSISFHMLSNSGVDSIATKKINLYMRTIKKKDPKLDKGGVPVRTDVFAIKTNVTGMKELSDDVVFTFGKPLKDINKELISLTKVLVEKTASRDRREKEKEPSIPKEQKFIPVEFEFVRDSITSLRSMLKADWEINTEYVMKFKEGAFTDILTLKSDSTDIKFSTPDPEEYGILVLDIEKKDSTKNYIIELVSEGGESVGHKIKFAKQGKDTLDYITPGKYMIKVTEDRNGNGKWDSGHLLDRRTPEETVIFKDEKGLSIFETKANWELEHRIRVDGLF